MKILIVDTIPKNARNQGSINLGFEIVKNNLNADSCFWWEKIGDIKNYKTIAFNIFYSTHLLNIGPFLKNNNIEPIKNLRNKNPYLIAGGQGLNQNKILSKIVDKEFFGEIDFEENKKSIITKPIIKKRKALIELTRGCKYKCKFCEYGNFTGGKYREKKIDLIFQQIYELKKNRIRDINFLSANFAGYSQIDKLINFCIKNNIRILNADSCLMDIEKILPYSKYLPRSVKLGIESFDEITRNNINKKISDDKLYNIILNLCKNFSYLHFYLIYGLPGDNFNKWVEWLQLIKEIRQKFSKSNIDLFGNKYDIHSKLLRCEFNITNFEPCFNTPFENEKQVDFKEKDIFLNKWVNALKINGYTGNKKITYINGKGRLGRKELTYKMLMILKNGGPELTDKILFSLPNGIGRSIKDDQALKFLFYNKTQKNKKNSKNA